MKPLKRKPFLFTLNGFGFSMYGRRKYDQETHTYIATHYLTLLFVPVFALGSYRVADAEEGGWYFIGKEKISTLWNVLNTAALALIVFAVGSIAWGIHTTSPDYRQNKALEVAQSKYEQGNHLQALSELQEVKDLDGKKTKEIQDLIEKAALQGTSNKDWSSANGIVNFVTSNRNFFNARPGFPEKFKDAVSKKLDTVSDENVEDAYRYSIACKNYFGRPKNPYAEVLQQKSMLLLERLATQPNSKLIYVTKLAEHYSEKGDAKRCKELLAPREAELKSTEGARILGQIYLSEGNFNQAHPLLTGYVIPQLENIKKASKQYEVASDKSYERAIQSLNNNSAPQDFYQRYEKANKAEQERMVNEFAIKYMEKDGQYKKALNRLRQAGNVVPVAMDLGIVQLRVAQTLNNPAEREKLLKAAEETFLAIQGIAGNNVDYQLSLGQVYYWMGKAKEGEKYFDEALKSSGESYGVLYSLGSIHRELGDDQKAETLLEKAYQKATNNDERYNVAGTLSTMMNDAEKALEWLEKCDVDQIDTKLSIANAKGQIAWGDGDLGKAEKRFLEAIAYYKQLPSSAAYLNNQSLVLQNLYSITGKTSYYKQAVSMMNEAARLSPNNSILITNAASLAFSSATIEQLEKKFSPAFIQRSNSMDMLRLLYANNEERNSMRDNFLSSDSGKQGFKHLGMLRILAPKSEWVYSSGVGWYWMMGKDNEVTAVLKQMSTIGLAQNESWKEDQQELLAGKQDQEYANSLKKLDENLSTVKKELPDKKEWLLYQLRFVSNKLTAKIYGIDTNFEFLHSLAKEAYEKYPSAYTRSVYQEVLLSQGMESASKTNPEIAKTIKKYGRLLGYKHIFSLLTLDTSQAPAKALIANKYIRAYLELSQKSSIAFSDTITLTDKKLWGLLGSQRKLPREINQSYQNMLMTQHKNHYQQYPYSASAVVSYYVKLRLSGKDDEAIKIYKKALKEGVALPPLNM